MLFLQVFPSQPDEPPSLNCGPQELWRHGVVLLHTRNLYCLETLTKLKESQRLVTLHSEWQWPEEHGGGVEGEHVSDLCMAACYCCGNQDRIRYANVLLGM